jgi:hypothetical protein
MCRHRKRADQRQVFYLPAVESLEDRLPPGDVLSISYL